MEIAEEGKFMIKKDLAEIPSVVTKCISGRCRKRIEKNSDLRKFDSVFVSNFGMQLSNLGTLTLIFSPEDSKNNQPLVH